MKKLNLMAVAGIGVAFLLLCCPNPETTPEKPASPTGLTGIAVSSSQVHLVWKDNADNETGFQIERSTTGAGGWTGVQQVAANVTAWDDTGLNAGVIYYYRVRASNGGGDSGYTFTVSVRTLDQAIIAPATFTQKVLIEEYTGTWCGYCPDGAYQIEQIMAAHPGVVFGAAYHDGDPMELPERIELANGIGGCPGYPTGAVNRVKYTGSATILMSRSYWATVTDQFHGSATPAKCGLKLSTSIAGNVATIAVSVGFHETLTGALRLTVLITEDNVTMSDPAYYQSNYYNTTAGSPFFNRGDHISDYVHMHVVRDFVTPVFGDSIDPASTSAAAGIVRTFSWTMPAGLKQADLKIIALVNTYGPNPEDKMILNVQEVALGLNKDWD